MPASRPQTPPADRGDPRRGFRRTPPPANTLDHVKEIRLRKGVVLDLGVNVYNVFNGQRPVSYVKQDTELFGQVWGQQLPRWAQIRLGVRF